MIKGIFIFLAAGAAHAITNPVVTFGICTGPGNGALMASNGYDYLEQRVGQFLMPDKSDDQFRASLERSRAQSPLPTYACNSFLPAAFRVTGQHPTHDAIVRYADTVFRRGKEAGVKIIVFGSGAARRVPEGFPKDQAEQQFVQLLCRLAPHAQSNGIVIVIEPLCPKECNFVTTVAEAFALANRVNHPAVQVLADTYHMAQVKEPVDHLIECASRLRHVHVADPVTRGAPVGNAAARVAPYLDALKRGGYSGGISIECAGGETIAQWAGEARRVISAAVSSRGSR